MPDTLAPLSSFWALGWTIVLGLLRDTKTLQNLEQRPECVVNLPSPDLWERVERLAPLTGLISLGRASSLGPIKGGMRMGAKPF